MVLVDSCSVKGDGVLVTGRRQKLGEDGLVILDVVTFILMPHLLSLRCYGYPRSTELANTIREHFIFGPLILFVLFSLRLIPPLFRDSAQSLEQHGAIIELF